MFKPKYQKAHPYAKSCRINRLAYVEVTVFKRYTAASKKYERTPIDGDMAAIFKDGRHVCIKLSILNVQVVDTPDITLTKNAHRICSAFWYSYSIWLVLVNARIIILKQNI